MHYGVCAQLAGLDWLIPSWMSANGAGPRESPGQGRDPDVPLSYDLRIRQERSRRSTT